MDRRGWSGWVLGGGLVMGLGCSGLVGVGPAVSSADVALASPTTLTYTDTDGRTHSLWLQYDLSFTQGDYGLTGPITASAGGAEIGSWQVDLASDRGPIVGSAERREMNSATMVYNGQGSASATVFLADLPAQPAGTEVTVTATLTNAQGTVAKALRLSVTD